MRPSPELLHHAGSAPDSEEPATPVSGLLQAWAAGDERAGERVLRATYAELKQRAARLLRHERQEHTLHTTALVHEAFCRLTEGADIDCGSRQHFLALAATAMRHVLVDYARARLSEKRGGHWLRIELDGVDLGDLDAPALLALHQALEEFSRVDPVAARVVELRYFGGYSVEETAGILASSPATVKRQWTLARAWLFRTLTRDDHPSDDELPRDHERSSLG